MQKKLQPREIDNRVERTDTEHRGEGRPLHRVGVVAFGEKVACADIEEKAGEEREQEPEILLGNDEKGSGDNSKYGRERIHKEPPERERARSPILNNHTHGVDAIGKIVREHGESNHDTNLRGNLERETDGEAIEETVHRKASRSKHAATNMVLVFRLGAFVGVSHYLSVAVKEKDAVKEEIQDKPNGDNGKHNLGFKCASDKGECFRKQVKKGYSEHRPSTKAKHEVQTVFEMQSKKPSKEGCTKGGNAYHDKRVHFLEYTRFFASLKTLT